jgi:hypothetical protein
LNDKEEAMERGASAQDVRLWRAETDLGHEMDVLGPVIEQRLGHFGWRKVSKREQETSKIERIHLEDLTHRRDKTGEGRSRVSSHRRASPKQAPPETRRLTSDARPDDEHTGLSRISRRSSRGGSHSEWM